MKFKTSCDIRESPVNRSIIIDSFSIIGLVFKINKPSNIGDRILKSKAINDSRESYKNKIYKYRYKYRDIWHLMDWKFINKFIIIGGGLKARFNLIIDSKR